LLRELSRESTSASKLRGAEPVTVGESITDVDNHRLAVGVPDSGHHRHSRIATLTYVAVGSVRYEDKNGSTGVLRAGGMDARLRRSLA